MLTKNKISTKLKKIEIKDAGVQLKLNQKDMTNVAVIFAIQKNDF